MASVEARETSSDLDASPVVRHRRLGRREDVDDVGGLLGRGPMRASLGDRGGDVRHARAQAMPANGSGRSGTGA